MTQFERLTAYFKSLDTRRPHLIMVKMGADGQPQWWSNQGMVMGAQAQEMEFAAPDRVENKPVDSAVHSE